ncbi:MAG: O-antigen ligase family protein [Pseudomonadota bacterium]
METSPSGFRNCLKHVSQIFAIITALVLPLSTAALEVFFTASILCCLCAGEWRKQYEILRMNPLAFMFLVFFALFVVGLSYTEAPLPAALHTLLKYSKFLFGFFLFSIFADEKTARYASFSFLVAVTLTLLLSYCKFFAAYDFLRKFPNDSGVFKDHIFTGFILAFGSYCYALIAFSEKKWRLTAIVLFLLAVYDVLFINMGRSGYIVFISLFLLLGWQQFHWKGFAVALVITIFLVASTLYFSANFDDRLSITQHDIQQYDKGTMDTSIGLRLSFYKNSLQLLRQHPWIGTGTGGFAQAYAKVEDRWMTTNPHNEYLNIAVQFGLLGIIVLLSLFFIHWHESFRLATMRKNFAQAVLVSIAVGSLFNSWLMDVTQGCFYVFFTVLAFSKPCKLSSNATSNAS